MTAAFQYRPRFVDIRVRPPKPDGGPRRGGRRSRSRASACATIPSCRLRRRDAGAEVARPARRALLVLPAARGRVQSQLELLRRHERRPGARAARPRIRPPAGGRPGAFKAGRGSREAAAAASRGFFRDAFGIFGRGQTQAAAEQAACDKRLGKLERNALADLDLDATADAARIRRRYTELLKRCHPDANGGDRSTEHKLQRVIKAFRTLRKAKLV